MRKNIISEINRAVIEIAWHFGPKDMNGRCCDNLTMPEFIALDKISTTENCPVRDVGLSLGFSKSGATRIVNRLEMKGYVRKIKSCKDARICCVEITDKGEAVLKSANDRYTKQFKELASRMTRHSFTGAADTIADMAAALKR